MHLNESTLRAVAALARIRVTEAETDSFVQALSNILTWVEQLEEVNTTDIPPTTSILIKQTPLRTDQVTDGGYPEKILANGADVALSMFAVPKVIE